LGSLSRQLIDRLGKLPVQVRHFVARIVCAEHEAYRVPGVGPGWVVIHLFGHQGNFCHEPESFSEVFELEGLGESVIFFLPHVLIGEQRNYALVRLVPNAGLPQICRFLGLTKPETEIEP